MTLSRTSWALEKQECRRSTSLGAPQILNAGARGLRVVRTPGSLVHKEKLDIVRCGAFSTGGDALRWPWFTRLVFVSPAQPVRQVIEETLAHPTPESTHRMGLRFRATLEAIAAHASHCSWLA